MATPFEYSRFHPTALRISRISDNTNHPKYSLSPAFSRALSFVLRLSFPPDALARALCLLLSLFVLSASPHSPSGIKTLEDETPAGVLHRATLGYGRKIRVESMSGLARASLSFLPGDARVARSLAREPWRASCVVNRNGCTM